MEGGSAHQGAAHVRGTHWPGVRWCLEFPLFRDKRSLPLAPPLIEAAAAGPDLRLREADLQPVLHFLLEWSTHTRPERAGPPPQPHSPGVTSQVRVVERAWLRGLLLRFRGSHPLELGGAERPLPRCVEAARGQLTARTGPQAPSPSRGLLCTPLPVLGPGPRSAGRGVLGRWGGLGQLVVLLVFF